MDYEIYSPDVTTSLVVNTYSDPSGILCAQNTSMAQYGGKFWAVCNASTTGYIEGVADQQIWMLNSDDGETWGPAYQPFRDSNYAANPFPGDIDDRDWQPALVTVGDELWCLWTATAGYMSILSDPIGTWLNYRWEFDGTTPYLSSVLTGDATTGRSTSPTVGGIDDWLLYAAGDPVVLSSGVVVCPATIYSTGHYTDQIGGSPGFTRALKYNVLLTTADSGGTWSMVLIDTSAFGDWVAWEPFISEDRIGNVYCYSRNLNQSSTTGQALLVARSLDGGVTFSASEASGMLVPNTRGAARKVTAGGRWFMAHCDEGNILKRRNGTLFVSRRGINDFIPGPQFSEFDSAMKYPSVITVNDTAYLSWTSGLAASDTTGVGRSCFYMATVTPLPADDVAYVHPRTNGLFLTESESDPELVDAVPPYYAFNGFSDRIVSDDTVPTSAGLTFVTWLYNRFDPPLIAALIDTRSGLSGAMHRNHGVSIRSMDVLHGFDIPLEEYVFSASTIDHSAMTVTQYAAWGQSDFFSKTSYFKSLLFTGQPSNAETVTVNGTVYTFKTTASVTNDVQIGSTAADTVTNLKTAINTNHGSGNAASNLGLDTRLIVTRVDGATFTATSGAANVTVETSVDLSGGVAYFGSKGPGSSVANYFGHMYGAQVYDSALSAANIRYLYNDRRTDFGYAEISGTSTAPSAPVLDLDPAHPDAVTFPPIGTESAHRCEVLDGGATLRLYGEASASVELPYGATELTIRYKFSDAPTGTDKFVIATFGTVMNPARLFINADNPTTLYLNRNVVTTVADPAAWNTVTVIVTANKATIGSVEFYAAGAARCILGNAYPESLLGTAKYIDYDITSMSAISALHT